jgi:hypothetical protein
MQQPGKADPNMYAYVRGSPIGAIDPTGLQDEAVSSDADKNGNPILRNARGEIINRSPSRAEAGVPEPSRQSDRRANGRDSSPPSFHLEQGTPDDPVVAGCAGDTCYLNIRQSRLDQLREEAKVNRSLRTLENIAGGILGALGYAIGRAASDDPEIQGAASDMGALGDQVLTAPGIAHEISPVHEPIAAEPRRSVVTEPVVRAPSEPKQLPPARPSDRFADKPLIFPPSRTARTEGPGFTSSGPGTGLDKLDYLLGKVTSPGNQAKSENRAADLASIGITSREQLQDALTAAVSNPQRTVSTRNANTLDKPTLLTIDSTITGPLGTRYITIGTTLTNKGLLLNTAIIKGFVKR